MAERICNVLFLCTGNSARSIMGEAIMNRMGKNRFRAWSAGSRPKGEVDPKTVGVREQKGYDTAFARSENWHEFEGPAAPGMDFVFTVCDNAAEEQCPVWPAHPVSAHRGIPDPAAVTGAGGVVMMAFHEAYRMLEQRISLLVNLPIASIGRLALQHKLDRIGKIGDRADASDVA